MRHLVSSKELSSLLTALNALAAMPKVIDRSPELGEAIRTGESWVARIAKEKWTGKQGLAIASAVVGIGAILYGTHKFLARDKTEGRTR
jgi:hypothetical protein